MLNKIGNMCNIYMKSKNMQNETHYLRIYQGGQIYTSLEERVGAAIGKGCTIADNVIFHKVYNGDWGVPIF